MKSRRFRHVSILLALLLVMQPFLGYMPTVMAQESLESGSIDVNELMGHQEEADFHEENLDTPDTGNADVQVEEGEKSEVKDSEAKDHAAKNESEAEDHKETPNQESTKEIDSAKVEEKQTKGKEEDKHHRLEVLDFTPENPYYVDFTNGNNGELKAEEGNMEVKYEDGYANVSTIGQTLVHDAKAPKIENGVLEMNMQFTEDDPSRFGFIFRYQDKGNYAALLKDAGNWVIHYKEDGKPTNQNVPALADVTFKKDTDYDVKLVYDEIYLTLFINGEEIINTTASNVPHKAGKIGIRSWFNNKTFKLDSITNYSLDSNSEEETGNLVEILHHETKVVVDDSFPRIDHYEWNGNTIDGYQKGLNSIRINNTRYVPTVSFRKLSDDVAEYQLTVPELAEILLQIKATANGVDINVTDIKELSDNMLVRTLDIPNLGLVSINSKDNEVAQEAAAWSTGAWHGLFEEYHDLHDVAEEVSGGRTFAFLNTDTYAATILNNVVDGNDKARVNIDADGTGNKTAAMWNGSWTYHENNALDPEPLPWSKIVFTDDQNDDGVVDWQDAAIAYRNIAETTVADGYLLAPYRHELVRDHISYISFNIGSQAGMPFLRQFDNAKKIANLTDDFGQLVLYKGYQAEGHDDSHPDYGGHIGIRQGGEEDFNYVLREGKKRNIIGGVHINATEYMLDAFETKMENLRQPLVNGWGWMDASYYVDQYKDVVTGELERRLNMLKDDTGDHLSFVYVDVYSGVDYKAKKLAEYINNNGWMLGTEFAGPLFEQVAWTHWGTDPGYPNQGNENKIIRFMRNHVMDGFMSHPMLKGLQQSGVGYWQDIPENKSFHKTQEVFYVHNLPTKYMQYFPIVKWEDDRIEMEQNVHVQREDDGKIHLYKDDKLIAIMSDSEDVSQSTVFIPWNPLTEEKVYHWNPDGGKTTWDVPNSWKDASSAMLYKLTDLGREFVKEVSIDNGKVELDVDAKTGYVLYLEEPQEQEEMNWGEGGLVNDPGFEGNSFEQWKKSSTSEDTQHIQMVRDDNGDGQLEVTGSNDATVAQVITGLTPGKTYSASVWAHIDGKRKVTIGVEQGDAEVTNWLDNTELKFGSRQHKYLNQNFQRVKVNFDATSDTATLFMHVDEGDAKVLLDDVRIWENPSKTDSTGYVLFEDFENVDEGWGPFVYSRSGPNRTHLAEKNPDKDQVKTFVIDGNFSLKSNENGNPGEWLRTLPQTLRLEQNKTYTVKMDTNAVADDMYTIAVRVNEDGEVRDLASQTLKEGDQQVEFTFSTEDAKDAYLAVIKNFNDEKKESSGILIVDNIRVIADLSELIEDAEAISNEDGKYTTESFAALQSAIERAKAALETIETEEDLAAAIAALQSAIDGLEESSEEEPTEPELDLSELEKLIETAKGISNEDGKYTSDSFAALQEAIKVAESALETIETEKDLAAAIAALQSALDGLEESLEEEPTEPELDVSELEKLIETAKGISNEDGKYTTDSFAALQEAIKVAESALEKIETEEDLAAAIAALQSAIDGLEESSGEKPTEPELDLSELEKLIETAKGISNEDGKYTSDSFAALQEAIKGAESALETIETEEDLVAAIAALQSALDGLEESSEEEPTEPELDLSELEKLIETAKAISNEDGKYTSDSFAALQEAIKVAESALETIETEEDLAAAIAALQSALDGLEESSGEEPTEPELDLSELEKLIETAKAISNEDGKYTSDSFAALQEAIKVAESALETIETEEDLAAAIAALQSALDGLEESSGEEPAEPVNPEDVDKDDTNQDGAVADSDNELPKTATTIFNWLALGFVFISLAFVLFVVSNRRRKQNI